MKKNTHASKFLAAGFVLAAGLTAAHAAHADTVSVGLGGQQNGASVSAGGTMHMGPGMGNAHARTGMMVRPQVMGTVAAVSGSTITVTGHDGTTYTVDASAATITKGFGPQATAIAAANVSVGDTVMAMGTLTGTNLVATKIVDGMPSDAGTGGQWQKPAVSGTVTAVSGTTITVTGDDSTVYSVDASAATFAKANAAEGSTITIAGVAVGDHVAVEGTTNGTSVVATKVVDGIRLQQADMHADMAASGAAPVEAHATFFAKIGAFFGHLKFW